MKTPANIQQQRPASTILVLLMGAALVFGAHAARADSASGAAGSAENDVTVIELTEKNTDVFYLQAKLGNAPSSEFLLDTGSGYLAIGEATLDELQDQGMARYQRAIHARMANGAVKPVKIYRIASLDLGGGCVIRDIDAAILPGNSRNIIGMNVLKQVDSFSVSFNPSRLTLSGCDHRSEDKLAAL